MKLDFQNKIRVYFIGIGGISMSGLAELLHHNGFFVSGSDQKKSQTTDHLSSLGIPIFYGQSEEHITPDIDLVVYTAAVHPDNPEYKAAEKLFIPLMDRASLLGELMTQYKDAIAVAGTHGKTTTTSMLSYVYLEAEKNPTISVGGMLKGIRGNIRIGGNDHFIFEACEYTNSFLRFHPTTEIILNIEADHLDFFKSLQDIRASFQQFISLLPRDGLLVINSEIPSYKKLISKPRHPVVTFSTTNPEADYYAANITFDNHGLASYSLYHKEDYIGKIDLKVPGIHNVTNSLAVAAAALSKGISYTALKIGLSSYEGTERRFEHIGSFQGVDVIDDYAHHPTEIMATLETARRCNYQTIWCLFQPHTYSRTKTFLNDIAYALSFADKVVLTEIYAAREIDTGEISSRNLLMKLKEIGVESYYFKDFEDIKKFFMHNCSEGDLLITMGAGNVDFIGKQLVNK